MSEEAKSESDLEQSLNSEQEDFENEEEEEDMEDAEGENDEEDVGE